MKPKFGVVVFPGSNCDYDAFYAVKKVLGCEAEFIWHKENDIKNNDYATPNTDIRERKRQT